jgi:hypothetical protein
MGFIVAIPIPQARGLATSSEFTLTGIRFDRSSTIICAADRRLRWASSRGSSPCWMLWRRFRKCSSGVEMSAAIGSLRIGMTTGWTSPFSSVHFPRGMT